MNFKILTLFPQMFNALNHSILKRAKDSQKIDFEAIDIRHYSNNKHKKCDDYPFGGGAGMIMSVQPIYDAVMRQDPNHEYFRIYMSPKGRRLDMPAVKQFSKKERILILCGHYEGIDQRAIDMLMDEEVSIGDYVLTGGELAAMVTIDCVSRYVEQVISNESLQFESFSEHLLEYPQYTRPQVFLGQSVPSVLLSGNHAEIEKWRKEQSLRLTKEKRPDILK